jgi:Mrp family chromosome partitioning ATPase
VRTINSPTKFCEVASIDIQTSDGITPFEDVERALETLEQVSTNVSGTDTDSMVEFKTQEDGEPVQYCYDGESVYKKS